MCGGFQRLAGQGLSIGVGMALADRVDRRTRNIFILNSDGENQEGQTWEAAMAAAHFELEKIIAFLDNNGLQPTARLETS